MNQTDPAPAVFTEEEEIRRVVVRADGTVRTAVGTVAGPTVFSTAASGSTSHLHLPADLPLGDPVRDRLLHALLAGRPDPRRHRTAVRRPCPGASDDGVADDGSSDGGAADARGTARAVLDQADRRHLPVRRVTAARHVRRRRFADGRLDRRCVHGWSSVTVEPAQGHLPVVEIHYEGAVRWDWIIDELALLAADEELPDVAGQPGGTVRLAPTATAVLLAALTSACLRSDVPQPERPVRLRSCGGPSNRPFAQCFDLDGDDTVDLPLSGPDRCWPGGRDGIADVATGHATVRPYAPIPLPRLTAVELVGTQPDNPKRASPVPRTGAVVTHLSEGGAGHLLEGSGFFLDAYGLTVADGVAVGRWGPVRMATDVADVLDRVGPTLHDGGYAWQDGLLTPRYWIDLRID